MEDYDVVAPEILDDPESKETFEGLGDAIEKRLQKLQESRKQLNGSLERTVDAKSVKKKLNKLFPYAKQVRLKMNSYIWMNTSRLLRIQFLRSTTEWS